jgi:tetratricopeptide (TPR) repeat protein
LKEYERLFDIDPAISMEEDLTGLAGPGLDGTHGKSSASDAQSMVCSNKVFALFVSIRSHGDKVLGVFKMKLNKNIKAFLLHLLVFASLASFTLAQSGKDGGPATNVNNDMAKVLELFDQKRFGEAAPYLENLIKAAPEDPDLRFFYGFSLFIKAASMGDKTEAKKLLSLARQQFVKAKELGSKENLDELIALIPADGATQSCVEASVKPDSQTFSKNKEVEAFMNKGEKCFAASDYDNAFLMYQEALKKEPTLYEAALWSGDVMMQKKEFDKAETWYQKAIQIDPKRETAYRYSATPLMKQKKYDEARLRYVEAYITEPYNERALGGLQQWSEVTGIEIGHPLIDVPATVGKSGNGNTQITLGANDKSDDGSFAWAAYGLARATWQDGESGLSDNFKKAYPNEKIYRHSLAEEYDALKLTVTTLKARMKDKDNPVKKLNPQLASLIKIYDEGLLEAYILLAIKDEGIAQDHPAYLKQNRDKLREYVLKYVFARPTSTSPVKTDG